MNEEDARNMDSSELFERFFLETVRYRENLLGLKEGSPYHSASEINISIQEKYVERTKFLRKEIDRRVPRI